MHYEGVFIYKDFNTLLYVSLGKNVCCNAINENEASQFVFSLLLCHPYCIIHMHTVKVLWSLCEYIWLIADNEDVARNKGFEALNE